MTWFLLFKGSYPNYFQTIYNLTQPTTPKNQWPSQVYKSLQRRKTPPTHARENSAPPDVVVTNDDLLTEILIRLPILCIHLFTTVSKEWLRILKTSDFTRNRSQITKVDPHVGFFVNHIKSLFEYDFVSLDPRLKSKKSALDSSFTLCSTKEADNVKILYFDHFDSAIYWNDALHWLEIENMQLLHYILNIEDHEHPILTTIQNPQRGMNFLQSYGYIDPMVILIQIPHMFHLEGKLFETRGCLLLVCRNDIGTSEFTIYEMMIGCSVWTVRYRGNIDDFMTPLS
ncbi:reverse transcriptase domain-containing protein [Tanacetum coccineum]